MIAAVPDASTPNLSRTPGMNVRSEITVAANHQANNQQIQGKQDDDRSNHEGHLFFSFGNGG
jgi:hypothetical protein